MGTRILHSARIRFGKNWKWACKSLEQEENHKKDPRWSWARNQMANPDKKQFLLSVLLIAILGSIFAGRTSAQGFKTLYTFTLAPNEVNSDGRNPYAGFVLSGTNLFGTAYSGGQHGSGVVFGLNTDGSGYTPYFPFDLGVLGNGAETNRDGGYPRAPLVFTGTALYGTASQLGTNGSGTVYEMSLATGFKVLHTFTTPHLNGDMSTNIDGANPMAGLVLAGTSLYGTAENGGFHGNGTIFKVDDTSLVFTNLHSFSATSFNQFNISTNGDGQSPQGGLILAGNILYGTTSAGGTNGTGTIFAVNTNGTGFTTLHHFGLVGADYSGVYGIDTNQDGDSVVAGLFLTNNTLYGVASQGGLHGLGTIFSLNTSGGGFTVLHTFAPGAGNSALFGHSFTNSDGTSPFGNLLVSGHILYGTASGGGAYANGTVFSVNTNGGGFATIYAFSATYTNADGLYTNADGVEPLGGLVISSNLLYGTAAFGGGYADGTLFSLSVLPKIGLVHSGTNVILTWTTNVTEFTVESTTNLGLTANWVSNTTVPVVLNGQYTLTNSTSGKQKFFRLIQ